MPNKYLAYTVQYSPNYGNTGEWINVGTVVGSDAEGFLASWDLERARLLDPTASLDSFILKLVSPMQVLELLWLAQQATGNIKLHHQEVILADSLEEAAKRVTQLRLNHV